MVKITDKQRVMLLKQTKNKEVKDGKEKNGGMVDNSFIGYLFIFGSCPWRRKSYGPT